MYINFKETGPEAPQELVDVINNKLGIQFETIYCTCGPDEDQSRKYQQIDLKSPFSQLASGIGCLAYEDLSPETHEALHSL